LIALAIVLIGLALAGALLLLLARVRGWDPAWAAAAGHSVREAAHRLGGSWSLLRERRPGAEPRAAVGAPPPRGFVPAAGRLRPALAAGLALAAVAAGVVLLSGSSTPVSGENQQSTFQADRPLLAAPTASVRGLLGVLAGLGVQRIRLTVTWSRIAPSRRARRQPRFDATDPGAYPPAAWVPYDRLIRLARARGMAVDLDITGPGPLWAMGASASGRAADHYLPDPRAFGLFVVALARRYNGAYTPTGPEQAASAARAGLPDSGSLPRITRWSIWNEPNQPASLAPQWRPRRGVEVQSSPLLYRAYLNEAVAALEATGHSMGSDTLLIGELAAEGGHAPGALRPMTPLEFVRALYCVDASERPLRGAAALGVGCPAKPDPQAFVADDPGLFAVHGFSEHPYDSLVGPAAQPTDPDVVTLSSLSRLSGGLDRIFAAYGVPRRLPLFVTAYGPAAHANMPSASSLDQATYIASRNPRISSFPVLDVYRPALWLPSARADRAGNVRVWGALRLARPSSHGRLAIEWSATGGAYRQIATIRPSGRAGDFTREVHVPGTGRVRLEWRGADGRMLQSRAADVTRPTG
jgi:hypothetical protein